MSFRIISAGAGSGKTYRLTSEMVELLKGDVRAAGIIATTFTKKAAAELQERVRVRLLEAGLRQQANELNHALIGTVHGLGVKLLQRFAYEAGVSPEVSIIADEDQQVLFNQSLATVLYHDRVALMEELSDRLGLNKRDRNDWRQQVRQLSEVARANGFSAAVLEDSKERSFQTFAEFLPATVDRPPGEWKRQLDELLQQSIDAIRNGEDGTKKTQSALGVLRELRNELGLRGELFWHQWVKISKIDVGAKSREAVADLREFAASHERHADFQRDIRTFIEQLFDIAMAALDEYDLYKKRRGLIDYTDMEVHINRLLDDPRVQEVLKAELDLLMVDEFQDTSPIQLEIFLKLSRFARYSVWVGDPKQSIYGFRGADPRLMEAIIRQTGIDPKDIQTYSWRSREEIVYATNALFTKAFSKLPPEQVALQPKRRAKAGPDTANRSDEPPEMGRALIHWHFEFDGEGRLPGKPWMENAVAQAVRTLLHRGKLILPKGEKNYRPARPGDVAILCRSNNECQEMAEALHRAGLRAAIARAGLLNTAEAKLVLACLKYILNPYDSLSVAEILLLAGGMNTEDIIEHRLDFLEKLPEGRPDHDWASEQPYVDRLNELRRQVVELSGAEILNLVLEELDLRRVIVRWGNVSQRLANVEMLYKLALQYEEACNRLHAAASLGGFLLWLNDLEAGGADWQGSGEEPSAVNVLTYHKSKGLEYPIVICHSLENNLRGEVWGIRIVPEREEVDLGDVLGGRWLRYWVNPYADQVQNTPLEERLQESAAQREATREALEEEARLLYVGLTRARDYLVFPTRRRPAKWLNRVWHEGQEEYPTLDPDIPESQWEWEGKFIDLDIERFVFPRDFPRHELPAETILYLDDRLGRRSFAPYRIDLRREKWPDAASCEIDPVQTYPRPLEAPADTEPYELAKALKALLAADRPGSTHREAMATDLLTNYDLIESVKPPELLSLSAAFFRHLEKEFGPAGRMYRKYPLRYELDGRLFETVVDLILETEQGWIVVQHSGHSGGLSQAGRKAKELADWFYLVKNGLAATLPADRIRTFLHLALGAGLVEVRFSSGAPQMSLF